ncbi:sensor histidine kinase [Isoptericola sp. NPDC056578]|uniref:sensor histidine kinase n=1 Tax=Isoptericola sp. NPDC056578 TaxID=3345870 RepID=UPI00368882CF
MFARATDDPGSGSTPKVGRAAALRWASVAGTVVAVAVSAGSSLLAVGFASHAAAPQSAQQPALYAASALVGLVLAGLLVLRQRYPLALCLGASACSVLLPLDSSAALLALPWVLATSAVRSCLVAVGATTAATTAALVRDALRDHEARVLFTIDRESHVLASEPTAAVFVVVGLGLLALSVAAGLVRRALATAAQAREEQRAQAAATAVLRDQMARQTERESIAREVHDTIAHHVAAISLQASALEVTHGADPGAVRTAREVRGSAQQAMTELRSLLSTLRSGGVDGPGGPGVSLDDLGPLLDQLRADGAHLVAAVEVRGAAGATTALARATLRIVQEAVTNAAKHAPGAPVDVAVQGGPDAGVDIRVVNATPTGGPSSTAPGTGNGMLGMRERAAALGGTFDAGHRDGRFEVRVHLPWLGRDVGADDTAAETVSPGD